MESEGNGGDELCGEQVSGANLMATVKPQVIFAKSGRFGRGKHEFINICQAAEAEFPAMSKQQNGAV